MGIHGLLRHLGSGKRTSLATLSAQHYVQHHRPLRLAVDISIWLFQIQAGQGGSNPALRTFYYRLLRLISLNIHPLFVFDGPHKPLFKRNKRVGGQGVRVATVPEFLAKQLLKQFAFPMHIAPGEAEAECALLQREGVVDAVLSEDVDTIMFGSKLTLRNWTAEGSSKTPTHVDVYNDIEILSASGLDTHGMILVALMSGGDYIPEGIAGCGPKPAVEAAKAGFGKRLCSLDKKDTKGLAEWREELQMEFRTNASSYFSRRKTTLIVPDDFPNFEVLGYYTHPCVSSSQGVEQLRQTLRWDLPLDLPALRSFAGDAFEWYGRGGAIKFIRNLSQALLPRQLRLLAEQDEAGSYYEQQERERSILEGLHSTRTHSTTDKAVEMRVSYIPAKLVPIDLSLEPIGEDPNHDEEKTRERAVGDVADAEVFSEDDDVPQTPSGRKRTYRHYEETEAEKIWLLREWVQLGCPTMLEDFEASLRVPRQTATSKAKSSRAGVRKAPTRARTKGPPSSTNSGMPTNALMRHVQSTRGSDVIELNDCNPAGSRLPEAGSISIPKFTLPSSGRPLSGMNEEIRQNAAGSTRTKPSESSQGQSSRQPPGVQPPRTPRKRRTVGVSTPQSGRSVITHFFASTPKGAHQTSNEVISLLSSSPAGPVADAAPPPQPRPTGSLSQTMRASQRPANYALKEVSGNIATTNTNPTIKRRQPCVGLQKSLSMPMSQSSTSLSITTHDSVECLDLAESPAQASTLHIPAMAATYHRPATRRHDVATITPYGHDYTHTSGRPAMLPVASLDLSALTSPVKSPALPKGHIASKPLAVNATVQSKQVERPKRSFIRIRESLDGAWTMATADTLDLTDLDASTTIDSSRTTTRTKKQARSWRASAVDTLDLTGE